MSSKDIWEVIHRIEDLLRDLLWRVKKLENIEQAEATTIIVSVDEDFGQSMLLMGG